jgi:hypothetical protein
MQPRSKPQVAAAQHPLARLSPLELVADVLA